jgi:hypothetical protein
MGTLPSLEARLVPGSEVELILFVEGYSPIGEIRRMENA